MEQRESYWDYMGRRLKEEQMNDNINNAMNEAKRSIWVTFTKEGVHMYPGADTDAVLPFGCV